MNKLSLNLRPGKGWKQLCGAVYEHNSGIRIHMLGLIRLPHGNILYATRWPLIEELCTLIKINGNNRKRGLMTLAIRHIND